MCWPMTRAGVEGEVICSSKKANVIYILPSIKGKQELWESQSDFRSAPGPAQLCVAPYLDWAVGLQPGP